MAEKKDDCPTCHGERQIKDRDGTIHLCFTCLAAGRMDQHDKVIKDSGIRI